MTCPSCRLEHRLDQPCMVGGVLVFGGRNYKGWRRVCDVLDRLTQRVDVLFVRHGDASGADTLGKRWAQQRGLPEQAYAANWRPNGVLHKGAGHIRNQRMIDDQDPDDLMKRLVCAVGFPGGAGTADMANRVVAAGLPLWRIQ